MPHSSGVALSIKYYSEPKRSPILKLKLFFRLLLDKMLVHNGNLDVKIQSNTAFSNLFFSNIAVTFFSIQHSRVQFMLASFVLHPCGKNIEKRTTLAW